VREALPNPYDPEQPPGGRRLGSRGAVRPGATVANPGDILSNLGSQITTPATPISGVAGSINTPAFPIPTYGGSGILGPRWVR
jgi:hypothetical protein